MEPGSHSDGVSAKRPAGWVAPGPSPRGAGDDADLRPAADETLDYLSGDWRIFQKRSGHRWSLDDLVTAWVASQEVTQPTTALDLGCGLGSVLMMTAWRAPACALVGIEAQVDRAAMARRSMRFNGCDARCSVIDGDLRDAGLLSERHFGLITGTPPYFPIGTGPESEKTHAGPCRFEHRGGVEAYAAAADRWLGPDGVYVVCASSLERERSAAALERAGLWLHRRVEVLPKEGKPPLIIIDVARRTAVSPKREALVVRGTDNQWTQPFREVRQAMGMPHLAP